MHPKHKESVSLGNDKPSDDVMLSEKDKQRRMFPGLALQNKDPEPTDAIYKEVDDLMSQLEGNAKKSRPRPSEDSREPKRQRRSRSPTPPRGRDFERRGGRNGYEDSQQQLDPRPVIYKIYRGKVTGIKDFGAFVQLEGVAGRTEGTCAV
jgi:ATP-dependent RNA helicase DHX8/PRP22